MDVCCNNCTGCQPITKAGTVTYQTGNLLPEEYLFDRFGQARYCTCSNIAGWFNAAAPRVCAAYKERPITAADIRWQAYILPIRFKDWAARQYVTLAITATEEQLEIRYKWGNRDKEWVFKVGDGMEALAAAVHLMHTDRYNDIRSEQMTHEPSRYNYWGWNKTDKEISKACYGYLGGTL